MIDTQFDIDGVRYVKPTPPMGRKSEFFGQGRPRKDSTGLKHCPTVAITFPDMTNEEWQRFRATIPAQEWPADSYEGWRRERVERATCADVLKPFVPMHVRHNSWLKWCRTTGMTRNMNAVTTYANDLFEQRVRAVFGSTREQTRSGIVPSRYVLVTTEEIGQDRANDTSHIAVMREQPYAEPTVRQLVTNARIFHNHALMLACAYAVAEGVDSVLWQKHLQYAGPSGSPMPGSVAPRRHCLEQSHRPSDSAGMEIRWHRIQRTEFVNE